MRSLLIVRFEAAKLVMQWLCNHEDQNMQRMAVAIISILAAKVNVVVRVFFCFFLIFIYHICLSHLTHILFLAQLSTEQTAQLGAEMFIVKVSFLCLFCGILPPACAHWPKRGQMFINLLFTCSNCFTLCVRRPLRSWWTPPSNLL